MFKRIIIGILSVVMAATMLCGCSFFSHNTERDYQQVAAVLESYIITTEVVEDVDGEDKTVKKKYPTPERIIYKQDLVEYLNNNASSLSQTYTDMESMVKHAMEMLVDTELVVNEVEALIQAGLIKWGQKEKNDLKKQIYNVIDSTLISLQNNILDERDKPKFDTDSDSANTDTTYPTKPDEEVDDDDDVIDEQPWEPSVSTCPGMTGTPDQRSLGKEAMRRFITLLENRVKDDFRVTAEERATFDKELAEIEELKQKEGVEEVYKMIGDTSLVYYISGKNIERSLKIRALQDYLTSSVTVSEREVAASYNALLNSQVSAYTAKPSDFDTAVSGSSPVLYYPNNDYFYVKHILLPFSDAQKAELEKFKARLDVTPEAIEEFRSRLVDAIVCYPHVAGEDDKSRPMTVDQVIAEIRAKMLPLEINTKEADRAFDDLIYLYNTDPGAFNNNKGYIVKDADSGNNYMEEFTDGARYMRANLSVGQVYYEPVVTDYGVHIMYLASTTHMGEVGLYDYTTPGQLQTYYDLLEEPIRTSRENAAYSSWEANILNYNFKAHATLYDEVYEDLWESAK